MLWWCTGDFMLSTNVTIQLKDIDGTWRDLEVIGSTARHFKYLKLINKNFFVDASVGMYSLTLNEVQESQWFFNCTCSIYKELQIIKERMLDILGSQYKLDGTPEYIKEQKDNIRIVYGA